MIDDFSWVIFPLPFQWFWTFSSKSFQNDLKVSITSGDRHLEFWTQFENSPWSVLVFFYSQPATLQQIPPLTKVLLAVYFFSFLMTLA